MHQVVCAHKKLLKAAGADMGKSGSDTLKQKLDAIYLNYNKQEFVNPDPLQFLYRFPDIRDREIAGLACALLAYGRVAQILKSVSTVLDVMGPSPHNYITATAESKIVQDFNFFKHRFTKGTHLSCLLLGVKEILEHSGSLRNCFFEGFSKTDETVLPALSFFVKQLTARGTTGMLAADPDKKSACKRNHLYLRWMVRCDAVDPGGWDGIPASKLLIPLDTHMHTTGRILGFTQRKQADIRTVMEITQGFQNISPRDPVKYDFSLTRFGIRKEMTHDDLRVALKDR